VAPKAEVCDGVDNDCNGSVDDNAGGCGQGEACVGGKCQGACKAVDGGWGAWLTGECSAKCGNGTQVSTRACDNPAPACGGKACVGPSEKSEPCTLKPCGDTPLANGISVFATGGQVFKGIVPAGANQIEVWAWGGGGGGGFPGSGGGGAFVHASISAAAGDAVEIRVAEGGGVAGGGGASYLWLNGKVVAVAAGGGGAGIDGFSGCEGGTLAGAGGPGGAVGQSGGNGADNNAYATNSGGGLGGTQTAGGAAGKQANASKYSGCTQDGAAGSAHTGGAGIGGSQCKAPGANCVAAYEKAGDKCPSNGGSGGGGAGWFGGGSGAAMYTYTGGGGGGGSSWLAPGVAVLDSAGGSGSNPGGKADPHYAGNAGTGGSGVQGAFKGNPAVGAAGLVVVSL
jgi:hypothetical protein